jgi:isopentenyl-diphosphate delta-isomerase
MTTDSLRDMIPTWVDGALVPYEKLAAHKEGLQHKAVSVFLIRDGNILIQRRALAKYHTPGLWANTCCTHPLWDETSLDCAVRRLDDELGITGIVPEFRKQVAYHADVGDGLIENEIVDIFVQHLTADLNISPNPDEVMETRWISLPDLKLEIAQSPEGFTPWLRIYLRDHEELLTN